MYKLATFLALKIIGLVELLGKVLQVHGLAVNGFWSTHWPDQSEWWGGGGGVQQRKGGKIPATTV